MVEAGIMPPCPFSRWMLILPYSPPRVSAANTVIVEVLRLGGCTLWTHSDGYDPRLRHCVMITIQ